MVKVLDSIEVVSFMDDGFDARPTIKKRPTEMKKTVSNIIPV